MRRSDRQITDLSAISALLKECRTVHLSCNAEGAPYVVPMNYGFALAPDGRLTLYLHCAAEGRKLDLLRRDARVGFAISALVETVRADRPCAWTARYRSLLGTGRAAILTDPEEKRLALEALLHHMALPAARTSRRRPLQTWRFSASTWRNTPVKAMFPARAACPERRRDRMVLLVSACLLGLRCRYDGLSKRMDGLERLLALPVSLVPVCPEVFGGLPTPRMPAERQGERVRALDGRDVTENYRRGAEEALRLAQLLGARTALLKERSPSCGCGAIYDGSFTGALVPGRGVAAALLQESGIEVFGESGLDALLARLAEGGAAP